MWKMVRVPVGITSVFVIIFLIQIIWVEKPIGYVIATIIGVPLVVFIWGIIARLRWAYLITHQYWKAEQEVVKGQGVSLTDYNPAKPTLLNYLPSRSMKGMDFADLLNLAAELKLEFVCSRNYVFLIAPGFNIHPHERIIASADLHRPNEWVLRKLFIKDCFHTGTPDQFKPNASPFTISEHLRGMIKNYKEYYTIPNGLKEIDLYYIIVTAERSSDVQRKILDYRNAVMTFKDNHNLKYHKELFFLDNPEFKDAPEEWVKAVFA